MSDPNKQVHSMQIARAWAVEIARAALDGEDAE